jgi:hypothetical protein
VHGRSAARVAASMRRTVIPTPDALPRRKHSRTSSRSHAGRARGAGAAHRTEPGACGVNKAMRQGRRPVARHLRALQRRARHGRLSRRAGAGPACAQP